MLEKVFECPVCYNLAEEHVYFCINGHPLCIDCFVIIINNAQVQHQLTRCPYCRTIIAEYFDNRKLTADDLIPLLPVRCQFCHIRIGQHLYKKHKREECKERFTRCKHKFLGCKWEGSAGMRFDHHRTCTILGICRERTTLFFSTLFHNVSSKF